jgi:hypothetical protein
MRQKELDDAMSAARATAGELTMAAGQVFAMRMALGAHAMSDQLSADHGEFAKIIPERTSAFAQAGMTWLRWSGEVAEQMATFAACEAATVAEVVAAMSSYRTPVDVIAMQSSFTTAWLARALSQSIALGASTLRSHSAALMPMHRTALANARQLTR